MIVAYDMQRAIGYNGDQLCYISSDLKRFKQLTKGKTVVMGRKTFESIGKPLPGRQNIIMTRLHGYSSGVTIANSIDEVLTLAESEEIWIIGGAEIYSMFMRITDNIYATEIRTKFEKFDTVFPSIEGFTEVERSLTEFDSGYDYQYVTYSRID